MAYNGIQQVVIDSITKVRKRNGYCEMEYDPSTESIIEKDFNFEKDTIYRWNDGTNTFDIDGINTTPFYDTNLIYINPKTIIVNNGTPSGDTDNLGHHDGLYYTIQEDTGIPGFDIDLTYFNLDHDFNIIIFNGRYEGNIAKNVKLQVYNNNTEVWDNITSAVQDLPHSESDYQKRFTIPGTLSDYYNDADEIKIKIYQIDAGNITYCLYIDQIVMAKRI